MKGLEK